MKIGHRKNKRIYIFGFLIVFLLVIMITILRTGYFVKPDLNYCQGIALEYASLLPEGLLLSGIENNEFTEKGIICFSFETEEDADFYRIEHYVYETWKIMKENISKNKKLSSVLIDIVIKNNTKAIGSGVRNYDPNGDALGDQWMIYNAYFHEWSEIEKYKDLYGLVGCNILTDVDIDNINPTRLSTLKKIYVYVGDEESSRVKNDLVLREIYPNADVDHSKYERMDIIYVIGR